MHCMTAFLSGTTQCIAALGILGAFLEGAFRDAVSDVSGRHEILRCTVRELQGSLSFVSLAPTSSQVEVRRAGDWRDIYQASNSSPLAFDQSPWRIKVVCRTDEPERWELLLITHHALMDGHGMQCLLHELLEAYGARLQAHPPGPSHKRIHPVPRSAESMLPRTLSWPAFKAYQAELASRQPKLEPTAHQSIAPLQDRQTKTIFFSLPAPRVRALSETARAANVSFNSLIASSLLRAVAERVPERDLFALGTAFSLRRLCEELAPEELGCYMSVLTTFHRTPRASGVVEGAMAYGRHLTQAILEYVRHPANVDYAAVAESARALVNIRSFVHDIGYTYAETAVRGAYPGLQVEHFFASAGRASGSSLIVLHGVKHEGAVFFTMNYTSPLQSHTWAAATALELERTLSQI